MKSKIKRKDRSLCSKCGRPFRDSFNLERHMDKVHGNEQCMLCDYRADESSISDHYLKSHGIAMDVRNVVFNTYEEFETWKHELEVETNSKYIKGTVRKNKNGITVIYFRCHRDGFFKSKGRKLRNLKALGSKKSGKCPSHMRISLRNNVSVKFVATHVGHTNDLDRLNLTSTERDEIANEIIKGVPVNDILDKLHDSIDGRVKRIHLTTKKDINNVINTYRLKANQIASEEIPFMEQSLNQMEFDSTKNTGISFDLNENKSIHQNLYTAEDICESEVTKFNQEQVSDEINSYHRSAENAISDKTFKLYRDIELNRDISFSDDHCKSVVCESYNLGSNSLRSESIATTCRSGKTCGSSENYIGFNTEDEKLPTEDHNKSAVNIECVVSTEKAKDTLDNKNTMSFKITSKKTNNFIDFNQCSQLIGKGCRNGSESDSLTVKKRNFMEKMRKMLAMVRNDSDMEVVYRYAAPLNSVMRRFRKRSEEELVVKRDFPNKISAERLPVGSNESVDFCKDGIGSQEENSKLSNDLEVQEIGIGESSDIVYEIVIE